MGRPVDRGPTSRDQRLQRRSRAKSNRFPPPKRPAEGKCVARHRAAHDDFAWQDPAYNRQIDPARVLEPELGTIPAWAIVHSENSMRHACCSRRLSARRSRKWKRYRTCLLPRSPDLFFAANARVSLSVFLSVPASSEYEIVL